MKRKALCGLLSVGLLLSICLTPSMPAYAGALQEGFLFLPTGGQEPPDSWEPIPTEDPEPSESTESSEEVEKEIREGTHFSDLTYETFDDTHVLELIDQVREQMSDASNVEDVYDLLLEIDDEFTELDQAYTLANLYSYLDVTDEYYSAEEADMYSLYYSLLDKVSILYKEILSSPCADSLIRDLTPEDIEYYKTYEEKTPEQLNLIDQEQELEAQFEELYNEEFTVNVNGRECTINDLYDLYYKGQISYTKYYRSYIELTKVENETLGPVYVELVKVRQQLAASFGYDNYVDYAYGEIYEREYSPEDANLLSEAVRTILIEAEDLIYANYDYDSISDLDNEVANMSVDEQLDLVRPYMKEVDEVLDENFTFMETYGLYDLDYSDTKISTGFTTWLPVSEEPFIYNQPDGSLYDLTTIIHEFGHFNGFIENDGSSSDLDLSEIHSQGLVALFTMYFDDMFEEPYAEAAVTYELRNMISSITQGCLYDEFQQQVYALEDPTLEAINKIYCEVATEYGYDYGTSAEAYDWVEIPHNFTEPFYYISYAISAFPALQIWCLTQEDPDLAIETYLNIVRAGEDASYAETITSCGLTSPFENDSVESIKDTIFNYFE